MTSYDYSEISERKRKLQDVAPASVHPRRPSSAREKERKMERHDGGTSNRAQGERCKPEIGL